MKKHQKKKKEERFQPMIHTGQELKSLRCHWKEGKKERTVTQRKREMKKKKVKLAWEATEVAWKVPLQMHLP